jgi:hypothetical protein
MSAPVLRIEAVRLVGPHELILRFNDGDEHRVDLFPVLTGSVFLPLRDPAYFSRVSLDPVAGTVVWPNGADFAPDYLRQLPDLGKQSGRRRESNYELQRSGGAGKVAEKPNTLRRAPRR